MIRIENLCKNFDGFLALDKLNLNIKRGNVYGLVGINGSGKTTIIKHLSGVYKQDSGTVRIDDEDVYDSIAVKSKVGYICDDLYFFPNYTINAQRIFYKNLYKSWNDERFNMLLKLFKLDGRKKLNKFSKGMQKQAAFIFVMSCMPDVLLLDEPLDGLDPIVRKLVLKQMMEDVASREMTVLVSSHNLREMEGICDSIGIVKGGKMIVERDIDELKSDVHKIQAAFPQETPIGTEKYEGLNILHLERQGSIEHIVVKGEEKEIRSKLNKLNPYVYDLLPLTLEEIFIYETDGEFNEIPY